MIESGFQSVLIGAVGPLIGVVVGSVLTWRVQRNEWDRQRQWELKRDVVFDVVRAMADLDGTVTEFCVAFSSPSGNLTEDAETALKNMKIEAIKRSVQCSSTYGRAHTVADLAIGGKLSRAASAYFRSALLLIKTVQSNPNFVYSQAQKELAKLHNAVIISAREALGIRGADDLPVLDYENQEECSKH
jgi:C4-dicarboxylate-specific signal transduction histidine kinase